MTRMDLYELHSRLCSIEPNNNVKKQYGYLAGFYAALIKTSDVMRNFIKEHEKEIELFPIEDFNSCGKGYEIIFAETASEESMKKEIEENDYLRYIEERETRSNGRNNDIYK